MFWLVSLTGCLVFSVQGVSGADPGFFSGGWGGGGGIAPLVRSYV